MITEFGARPEIDTSNLEVAAVITPPVLVTWSVTVAEPVAPVSVGWTTTGATSLVANRVAVKMIVSVWACAAGIMRVAADTPAIINMTSEAIYLFIICLLNSVKSPL
jgi:hypothetical protein